MKKIQLIEGKYYKLSKNARHDILWSERQSHNAEIVNTIEPNQPFLLLELNFYSSKILTKNCIGWLDRIEVLQLEEL